MKNPLIALAVPVALFASAGAFAGTQDCATRIRALHTQIDNAKRFGNTQQAMRQQAALERIQANCTDGGQLARAERKLTDRTRDLRNAEDEVRHAQARVHEAEARGDAKKLNNAQRKLADKQAKLRNATRDLHDAQVDRDALKALTD
ncbi:DUF1090 family protein [Burkholderia sp. AU42008]|uniref:DUF1090 family protein n=1 Tax=unclassified Burkholderia TaxID=2613784 RepID=UPI000B79CBEE|nr:MULTISPECIES: DUF1090 family protein [unclassified Burkholderia]RQU19712.1 DUF1090 family protein [Burkholderia cenocepacia]MBR8233431.1 DUF1090 family protein [Burkholderia sp. AU32357]MBY4875439.1 DUF1090 family protein [Burkholderia sp. AU42008]OXI40461.1 hypothetical protein CFB49_20635 [Burkholderia sp. AU17457]RQU27900.1 DUF1090 family protein [Burkholderia cenocepacia]